MAIDPSTQLAPNITAPDANYPYGSSKSETAPGALDGTPYNKTRADDIFGFEQALLVEAGIVPSGTADTAVLSQYLEAVKHQALTASIATDDTTVANAFEISVLGSEPTAYRDGQTFIFKADLACVSGAATLKVGSLAAKSFTLRGLSFALGDVEVNDYVMAVYNQATDRFRAVLLSRTLPATETERGGAEIATTAEAQAGTVDGKIITPAKLQDVFATISRKGVIELATQAEVDNGVDNQRAVTPNTLANRPIPQAETSFIGGVALATQAEVDAGLELLKAVVPDTLSGELVKVLSSNGYIRLPSWMGGLVIQWFSAVGATSTRTSYAIPFGFSTSFFGAIGSFPSTGASIFPVAVSPNGLNAVWVETGTASPNAVFVVCIGV